MRKSLVLAVVLICITFISLTGKAEDRIVTGSEAITLSSVKIAGNLEVQSGATLEIGVDTVIEIEGDLKIYGTVKSKKSTSIITASFKARNISISGTLDFSGKDGDAGADGDTGEDGEEGDPGQNGHNLTLSASNNITLNGTISVAGGAGGKGGNGGPDGWITWGPGDGGDGGDGGNGGRLVFSCLRVTTLNANAKINISAGPGGKEGAPGDDGIVFKDQVYGVPGIMGNITQVSILTSGAYKNSSGVNLKTWNDLKTYCKYEDKNESFTAPTVQYDTAAPAAPQLPDNAATYYANTSRPAVQITVPTDSGVSYSDVTYVSGIEKILISYGAAEPLEVKPTAGAASVPVQFSTLAEGSHNLSLRAVDYAGNTSASVTKSLVIDTTAPRQIDVAFSADYTAVMAEWSVEDSNYDYCKVYYNNTNSFESASFQIVSGTSSRCHVETHEYNERMYFWLYFYDKAGNYSSYTYNIATDASRGQVGSDTTAGGTRATGYWVQVPFYSKGMEVHKYRIELYRRNADNSETVLAVREILSTEVVEAYGTKHYEQIYLSPITRSRERIYGRLTTFNSDLKMNPDDDNFYLTLPNNAPQFDPAMFYPEDNTIINQYTDLEDVYLLAQAFDADEEALTYTFYLSGIEVASIVDSSGEAIKHAFESLPSIGEGAKYWRVRVSDGYNTVSSQSYYLTVDYTPPSLMTVIAPEAVNQPSFTLILGNMSGVRELKISLNGSSEHQAMDIHNRTITLPDFEGEQTIRIYAADAAGNWNAGTEFVINLDKTAPPQISSEMIAVTSQAGAIKVDWPVQTDISPTAGVKPSGVAKYAVTYTNPSTGVEGASGYITTTEYIIPDLLANQAIDLQVGVIDKAGNVSYSDSITAYTLPDQATLTAAQLSLDPEHPNTYPIQLTITPGSCATYDIIRYDGKSLIPVTVATDLQPTVGAYIDYPGSLQTSYTYKAVTKNPSGDSVDSDLFILTMRNYPPEVGLSTTGFLNMKNKPLLRATITDVDDAAMQSVTFTFNKYAADGTKQTYITAWDANYTDPATYQPVSIEDGKYECIVTVNDGEQTGTVSADFYIDTTPPVVTCAPASVTEVVSDLKITVTSTDGPVYCTSGLKTLEYYWEGTSPVEAQTVTGQIDAPNGNLTLYIIAEDNNGNKATYSFGPYKVDKTPPIVSEVILEGLTLGEQHYTSGAIIVRWQDEENESEIIRDEWVLVPADQASTIGNLPDSAWQGRDAAGTINRLSFHDGLVDGEAYVVGIRVKNQFGMLSTPLITPAISVDRTAPEITFIDSGGTIPQKYNISSMGQLTLSATASEPDSMLADIVKYALVTNPNSNLKQISNWSAAPDQISAAGLTSGTTYYLAARCENILGTSEEELCTTPVYYDASGPVIQSVVPGQPVPGSTESEQRETDRLKLSWNITDESPLTQLRVKIGTTAGGNQISSQVSGNQGGWLGLPLTGVGQTTLTGMQFADQQYFVTLEATNSVGLVTTADPERFLVDSTLFPVPVVTDDGFYTAISNSLHFTVDFPEPFVAYQYQLTNAQGEPLHAEWIEAICDPTLSTQSTTITLLNNSPLTLQNGQTYYIKVQVSDAEGLLPGTGYSDGITIDNTEPVVDFQDDYYNSDRPFFSWLTTDAESAITGIQLAVGSTRGAVDQTAGWITVTGSDYQFSRQSLTPGLTYFATLKVRNGAGLETTVEGDGFIVDATPPPSPNVTPLSLFVNAAARMQFDWQFTLPDPESGLQCYQYALLTSQSWNNVQWQDFADPAATSITFDTEGMIDGQVYYLALRAINGAGMTTDAFSSGVMYDEQCPTSPVIVQPLHQTSTTTLSATFSALDWGSGLYGYSYSIYTYPLSNPAERTLLVDAQNLAWGQNSVTQNLALTEGNVYYFTVTAIDQAGNVSALSTSQGVLVDTSGGPVLGTINDAGEFSVDNTQLAFNWSGSYTYTPVSKYKYALTQSTAKPADSAFTDVNMPQVTITANQVDPTRNTFLEGTGHKYYLHVKAIDWWNREDYGVSNGIVIDSTPPSAPVVLERMSFVATTMSLEWSASSDGQSGILNYKYALGTTRGGDDLTSGWCDASTNSVTYTNTALEHNQRIYLKVRAVNKAGNYSTVAVGNGVVVDKAAPETPVVRVPAYLGIGAALEVKVTSRDNQVALQGYSYEVYRGAQKIANHTQLLTNAVAAMEDYVVSISAEGLQDGQSYTVKVKTVDANGNWSAEGTSNTMLVDLTKPTLSFVGNTTLVTNDGNVSITWNPSEAGTAFYRLRLSDNQYKPAEGYYEHPVEAGGEQQLSITVDAAGTYQLQMYMVDLAENRLEAEHVTKNFRYNAAPTIAFGVSELSQYLGRNVLFPNPMIQDQDGKPGQIYTYNWSFGDGEPDAAAAAPTHVYATVGTFTASLSVTDEDGGTGTASLQVIIGNTLTGSLQMSEIWSGDISLLGDITVPEACTLTIEPGTTIRFISDTGLTVSGKLVVYGTAEQPVLFTAADTTTMWKGIRLDNNQQPGISYITVERAKRGLILHNQSITVSNSTFQNNEIGIHIYGGVPAISYSIFSNNQQYGIKEDGVTLPLVTFNVFSNNVIAPYYHKVRTLLEVEAMNVVELWSGNTAQ